MASTASLICNFKIDASIDVDISFKSNNGGGDYGGQITIFTPYAAGPLTTGLWDNDGNVYFTIYSTDNPAVYCVINSGSNPGSWDPYVVVAEEAGLTCAISDPQPAPDGGYTYTLTVAAAAATADAMPPPPPPPPPSRIATMVLPAGGKQAWTNIMQGAAPVPDEINPGSPVVMAYASFPDGTQVAGGVYKSDTPAEYNVIFMWVMDPNGNQYPGWPIDVGDFEDFFININAVEFALVPDGPLYQLNVVEG